MANENAVAKEGFNEILLYTTPNGKVKVEIFLQNETIWLNQQKIAELFGVDRTVVTKHLNKIFIDGELQKDATCAKIAHVQKEGQREVTRLVEFYNLDAIISVGYRVNSTQATHFRIWATERLKEYVIKGFTMDDERLKNPTNIFGKDYFEEQLARIRDIRSSERRFYQKITDIYSECSIDYVKDAEITELFFATVQNKLHWAITGQTAAEIIATRVDSNRINMGLTAWKNGPSGKIRKTDIGVAKNYLNEKELDGLNRIVTMYLDYAESQAQKKVPMYMKDWIERLDAFLQFNEQSILKDTGKVSHMVALALAEKEFKKYSIAQDRLIESDFDKILKEKKELQHTEVKFYDPVFDPGTKLTYSVISAKFKDKWIFVRHNKRITWEIAGGHIEEGETSFEAAGRELMEETGALKFDLVCIATYSVKKDGETGWGRLYLADVKEIGPIPDMSEIAEIAILDKLPENPTHPDIQPHLFRKTLEFIG